MANAQELDPKPIELCIELENDTLHQSLIIDKDTKGENKTSFSTLNTSQYPKQSLLQQCLLDAHEAFFKWLPCQNFGTSVVVDSASNKAKELAPSLDNIADIYQKTNELLLSCMSGAKRKANKKGTLFLNCNEQDLLRNLFVRAVESVDDIDKDSFHYLSYDTGYNTLTRTWEAPSNMPSPKKLINYLLDHNVERVVCLNMYYQGHCLSYYQIFILSVFKHLGIELTTVDWDHYGLPGYLEKALYNDLDQTRYSAFACIGSHWDNCLNLSNVQAYPQGYSITKDTTIGTLGHDYSIVCLANSRIDNLTEPGALIFSLAALEFTSDNNLFHDFQTWFHATAYYLAHHFQAELNQKILLHQKLVNVFFLGVSILKYEAINSLTSKRKIFLFGDQGWSSLFPQYYQNKHLKSSEQDELLNTGDYLQLHLNEHFSYLEPNPVVINSYSKGIPYLGFPAVTLSHELKGLSLLEYRNTEELNSLVDQVNERVTSSEFRQSEQCYRHQMSSAWNNFSQALVTNKPEHNLQFKSAIEKYQQSFGKFAEQYIQTKGPAMNNYLNALVSGGSFELSQSRFYQRGYIQKILTLGNNRPIHVEEANSVPQASVISQLSTIEGSFSANTSPSIRG